MQGMQFNLSLAKAGVLKSAGAANPALFYDSRFSLVKLAEVPEPQLPGTDWVKVKTSACGFCGSDLNLIFLRESLTASPFSTFPSVMGHEMCGRVESVGSAVRGVQPGDLVTVSPILDCKPRGVSPVCSACAAGIPSSCENFARGRFAPGMFMGVCKDVGGGFAPFFVAHESQVYVLPEGTADEEGALLEPFCVGLSAVLGNTPKDSDKVLVVGGGVIGNMVVRALRALGIGCRITVSEPASHAAEFCRVSGADHIIEDGDVIKNSPLLTGATSYKPIWGRNILMGGFDRIFDTVGSSDTLNASLRCLAAGGTLSVVGIGDSVKLDLTPFWLKNQKAVGVLGYGFHTFEGKSRHVFEIAVGLLAAKKVALRDLCTHRFALSEYKEMIAVNVAKGRNRAMKTVVTFT
ncbi:MAG: alcohol dehydrogenase catalytic domain-containing protein [Thermodesulfobacteriota bacterium]